MRAATLLVGVLMGACATMRPPPEPPATPPSLAGTEASAPLAPVTAGLPCVHARARCELGWCAAEVHNECGQSVQCELTAAAECGDAVPRRAVPMTVRESIPVDGATTLEAGADCGSTPVASARIEWLSCR